MNSRPFTLTLAVALGLASPDLSAMGLGPLQVKSGLNQPLVAEIPIISATPGELEQLDVRLASPEAFARIGLERPGELTANLQFSVGKNARGQPVILVTTPGRFSEPLLNFLIEANWGKGTVTREYAALVDPPYIAPAVVRPMQAPATAVAAAPVVTAPIVEPAAPEAAPGAAPEPEPKAAAPVAIAEQPTPPVPVAEPTPAPVAEVAAPAPAAQPEPARPEPSRPQAQAQPQPQPQPLRPQPAPVAAAEPRPDQVGPVAPGQTLWAIADQARPPAISVNQMMVALLRANPDAFIGDNVNRLRQGSVLRVPGEEEVARLSAAQAAELVNRQAEAWRTPRAPVPQPAEVSTPAAEVASAPRPTAPAPNRRAARLEIVPPSGEAARGAQSGAAAGAGGTELRAELVQAREDLAAKDAEASELRSRVAELEKQQSDRQRLIELQNSQMKALQDRLRQLEARDAAGATAAATAATPAASVSPTPPAPNAAAARPWYLNPFAMGGAGLLVLGGLVLAMRRSRPQAEDDTPSRRLSDDDALRESMAKTRAASAPIPVAPVAPEAAKAPAPAAPVDNDLQARRDAVRTRPQDLETHLNLLRLFHARGNAVDYEQAAQAMRAQVGSPLEPRWREAVVMGASLMPGHPLFSQAGWNTPRYDSEPKPAAAPPVPRPPVAEAAEPKVFEYPEEVDAPAKTDAERAGEVNLGAEAAVINETFGDSMRDIHRDEAQMLAEDAPSATRIELAKAYLDIGDLDGARSMLEEVLIEGGPTAKAEAARLLKELG